MRKRSRAALLLLVPLALGTLANGCSDSDRDPPPATNTNTNTNPPPPPPPPQGSVGSRYWYENDTFGNPLKTHTTSEQSLADQVLALVNQERTTAGLNPLTFDPQAQTAAKAHAEDMAGRGFFDHFTPEGWTPTDRLNMLNASGFSMTGENIAVGQPTPADVMTAWMNSTGHRANILRAEFTHLGVGVDEGSSIHWVQVFLRRP